MGMVSVYYIESRVDVNNLLGLVCTEEMPKPVLGNQNPSTAGDLGVCI